MQVLRQTFVKGKMGCSNCNEIIFYKNLHQVICWFHPGCSGLQLLLKGLVPYAVELYNCRNNKDNAYYDIDNPVTGI
jgi:hypothetical protein